MSGKLKWENKWGFKILYMSKKKVKSEDKAKKKKKIFSTQHFWSKCVGFPLTTLSNSDTEYPELARPHFHQSVPDFWCQLLLDGPQVTYNFVEIG